MSQFEALLQNPLAAAFGRTLLHSLWEGAAIALALALGLPVLRSSRARYAASCAAMVLLLAGFAVTFARLMPELPAHVRLTVTGHVSVLPPWLATLPPLSPGERPPTDDLAWLAPFWIAGVLIFYLRGAMSWMAARRLRRTGVCCVPNIWLERLARLKAQLRVTRPVALLESCLAEVPAVTGYWRPMILMPVGLLAGLPVVQVEAILLHELAHIRRYDYLMNLLQVFVEGLLFYHPAMWWISGVMRVERENCCDDLVVAVTGGALEYAAALTALERSRTPREVLAITGGSLVNRIQRLLGRRERRYAAMPLFTAAILTVTTITAMAALQLGSGGRSPVSATADVTATPDIPETRAVPLANTVKKALMLAQAEQTPPKVRVPATQQAGTQAEQTPPPDKVLFDRATVDIEKGRYLIARLSLNTLINNYPNSDYVIKAKLAIADSWLREGGANGVTEADAILRTLLPKSADKKELEAPYKKWLDEDVVYIISDEERKAFHQLNTDEEREKFVEQFWLRRDPTPATTENEFKTEFYRRIAYANEHFAAGLPGWRTDRGRIYIQYGPPDAIEAHDSGGAYQRPAAQGGGTIQTFPFEQWLYRHIDGIGQNITIEFVDKDRNGEFRITMDPTEKDMPLHPQAPAPVR